MRLGTRGASAAAGGLLAPGASTSVRFQVLIDPAAAQTTLDNQATLTYIAQTIGSTFTYAGNRTDTEVAANADLRGHEVDDAGPAFAGGDAVSTITVTNDGPNAPRPSPSTTRCPTASRPPRPAPRPVLVLRAERRLHALGDRGQRRVSRRHRHRPSRAVVGRHVVHRHRHRGLVHHRPRPVRQHRRRHGRRAALRGRRRVEDGRAERRRARGRRHVPDHRHQRRAVRGAWCHDQR